MLTRLFQRPRRSITEPTLEALIDDPVLGQLLNIVTQQGEDIKQLKTLCRSISLSHLELQPFSHSGRMRGGASSVRESNAIHGQSAALCCSILSAGTIPSVREHHYHSISRRDSIEKPSRWRKTKRAVERILAKGRGRLKNLWVHPRIVPQSGSA